MIITIAIPCYGSENTIEKVVQEIKNEFQKHSEHSYQIILVNDCSPDNVFEKITGICNEDENVTGINLSRNYGQASAKLAALDYVDGDVLVYMDDDGQHPASGIFALVDKINDGYDVVYARFPHKKHSIFKRMTSSLNHKISVINGNSPGDVSVSSFMAYSSIVVDALKKYKSPFVSAGGYLMHITTKYANVDIEHRERIAGSSGYSLKKLLSLWLNCFTNFSIVPLRAASLLGIVSSMIGFVMGIATVVRKITNPNIAAGYSSTISIMLFIGGIIMLIMGFLGEYIGRIYMTVSNLPQYNISEVLNEKNKKDKWSK